MWPRGVYISIRAGSQHLVMTMNGLSTEQALTRKLMAVFGTTCSVQVDINLTDRDIEARNNFQHITLN